MAKGISEPKQIERFGASTSPLIVLTHLGFELHNLYSTQFNVSLARLLPKLGNYLEKARNVADLNCATEADVRAWVDAPLRDGRSPSVSTRRNRRAAARFAFRLLRQQGIVGHDPTLDLVLPHRDKYKGARPLSDAEILAGRAASYTAFGDTLRQAVWALAEATATTHEIPYVTPEEVDLVEGSVWLGGTANVESRVSPLTDWGVQALRRRIKTMEDKSLTLVFAGSAAAPASKQARAATVLSRTLREAGLSTDPRVKPSSIRAWAGLQVFQTTQRIDKVALALGSKTLDNAAAIIGFDWQDNR